MKKGSEMRSLIREGIPVEGIAKAFEYAEEIAKTVDVHPHDCQAYVQCLVRHHFRQPTVYKLDQKGFPVLKNQRVQYVSLTSRRRLNEEYERRCHSSVNDSGHRTEQVC